MIDVPCYLLGIYPKDGWLVGFDDPGRGLSFATPCYVPEHCVYGFAPKTGSATHYAPGTIRLADNVWENLHNWIAKDLKERQRIEAIERRAAQKKAEQNPRSARRNEDRMLRARKEKRAQIERSRQQSLI